ncbi:MAG: helix-turn-helix domain-containing protein [Oscillospiraceae bacterium]|nr:helix-turn-helix domain-containing protein [Oscillospiraceae bacterium]
MNILIVDDQAAVLRGLERGINWESLGFSRVYTAGSAGEAKLILLNYDIDILLTDIEMPEESGLELFRWTRGRYPNLVGVFLTSHAEFGYVKEAMALGGFDYILQPARFSEVERVILMAADKVRSLVHIEHLKKNRVQFLKQRERLFARMVKKEREGADSEVEELFTQLTHLLEIEHLNCGFRLAAVRASRFPKGNTWTRPLLRTVFQNVVEELLQEEKGRILIAGEGLEEYLLLVTAEAGALSAEKWNRIWEELYGFIGEHMDFSVSIYPLTEELGSVDSAALREMRLQLMELAEKAPGVYTAGSVVRNTDAEAMAQRIQEAMVYIRENLGQDISRAELAEQLHLNEEYFSKLFHKYAGCTFKEYVMEERLRSAQRLLKYSRLSISLIASKVGYDNFSYFSKAFKKATGLTPQEYRREHGVSGRKEQGT